MRFAEELEEVSFLLSACFDDGQHCFDEATAGVTLGSERQLLPDHCVTQAAFGNVVGWFNVCTSSIDKTSGSVS